MPGSATEDELIVHRALESRDGCAVVAVRDGELTIRRLRISPAGVVLQAKTRPSRTSGSRPWRTRPSGASRNEVSALRLTRARA